MGFGDLISEHLILTMYFLFGIDITVTNDEIRHRADLVLVELDVN